MKTASVGARQVLDCKARPLLEVEIITDTGHVGRGAAPTGTSVGAHEAFVLRDGDRSEYNGLSVHRAVSAVTDEIAPVLVGAELDDPRSLDRLMIELDGTPDKRRLGGNAIYSTSIALLRAAAAAAGMAADHRAGAQLQHDQRWSVRGCLPDVQRIPRGAISGGLHRSSDREGCDFVR